MQFFCFTKKHLKSLAYFLCYVQILEYFPPITFLNAQETVILLMLVHKHTLTQTHSHNAHNRATSPPNNTVKTANS